MLRGNRVSQQPGKVQNQLVANGVAEAVVDAFQVVHVKDDTGGRSFDEFHIVEQLFALALVRQSRVKVDVAFCSSWRLARETLTAATVSSAIWKYVSLMSTRSAVPFSPDLTF